MVIQTAFTAVEEEENAIGKYRNEYSRYYRFRNHLALNVYYRENNLFPKSLQIDVPKQNFGADDPKLRQQWLNIIQNASKDLLKCEAQAIERTIAEAEAKCELLREKLCEMRKEREMMDVEREESVKLKETIESSWNKVFRLEMREITPRKTKNESSDDVTSSSMQNILGSNDLPNTQNVPLHAKLHRPRVSCFGCGKDGHIQSRCFAICSFCNGRKHSEEFCKKIKKVSQPSLMDTSCDPMVDELKRIGRTDDSTHDNDHPSHTNTDSNYSFNQNSTRPTTSVQAQLPASRRFTHRHMWRNTNKYDRSSSNDNRKFHIQKNYSVTFDSDTAPNRSRSTSN
ncbi:unnamed protein product [Didymodactylos carnosus]|uniref:CCHC-type domain-containing protein n=1 Tax=Didymodactylos carnosus TaxID=1234261 RepID=A0A815TTZ6_9BILA|nr:unnamed protein product [Didymodactylos carnosus]CAF1512984.1 unnamed protein product [Didymodactylos carnosus]CAF4278991.1 unnamed protein product [Didymodactylos carnosus]CAF4373380.1 unnamed protein product [Didymodactylos carnosus]